MYTCQNPEMIIFLSIAKRILTLIEINAPILLIISLTIIFIQMIQNPEDKKLPKKLINACMSLVIIFFIPLLITITLNLVEDNSNFGDCWKQANKEVKYGNTYISTTNDNKKKNPLETGEYEKGNKKQDTSTNNSNTNSNSSSSSNSNNNSNITTITNSDPGVTTETTHKNNKNNLTFNLYNQSDSRWGAVQYSNGATIQSNGCMITSTAVVSSAVNKSITPKTVFDSKYRHQYPRDGITALSNNGYNCSSGSTSANNIISALNEGKVVVIMAYGRKKGGSSPFTSSQHYMALIDISGDQIFIGNAYSNSGHGKWGWYKTSEVFTSVQSADYCTKK